MRRLVPALALALAACAPERGDPLKPPQPETPAAAQPTEQRSAAQIQQDQALARANAAPHIYMVLQPDPSGPLSVIFAIDAQKNDTPQDDPAIRITPEDGKCNPQDLARFNFPKDQIKPVFGPDQAFAGITARDLPNFMAMAVTAAMLDRGLITEVDQSKPQNVCTRKLWEQLTVNEGATRG